MHTPDPKQKKQKEPAAIMKGQNGIRLPHEHDQSHDSQGGGPHKVMRQAKRDVEQGIVDTDRRGSYGLGEHEGLKPRSKKP